MSRSMMTLAIVVATVLAGPPAWAQVKIGVVLTLSGPLATDGKRAHEAIRTVFGQERQITTIIQDDEGKPDVAARVTDRLISEDKVVAVIGPLTMSSTVAVAPRLSAARIPAISLAGPSRARLAELTERYRQLVMFAPVPMKHVDILASYFRRQNFTRVGLAYFNPASAGYAEEIAAQLGKSVGRLEASLKAPTGTSAEVEKFAQQVRERPPAAVIGTVAESLAAELVTQIRRQKPDVQAVLFSPPPSQTKGRLAATLILDGVKRGAKTPDEIFRAIESATIYQKDIRALALDWTVLTYATDAELMKQIRATSADTTSCSCNSKDGKVCKQKNCAAGQKCKKEERDDDCTVECVAS